MVKRMPCWVWTLLLLLAGLLAAAWGSSELLEALFITPPTATAPRPRRLTQLKKKMVAAARQQVAAIQTLIGAGALAELAPVLRATAQLRLDNPEMTLTELAEQAGASRPTVAGRLRRLIELGDEAGATDAHRRPHP